MYARIVDQERWYGTATDIDLLPADPLADFNTKQNSLSLWLIEDGGATIEEVAVGYSLRRQGIKDVDVFLFSDAIMQDLGLTAVSATEELPVRGIGSQHRNVRDLKAGELLKLVGALWPRKNDIHQFQKNRLKELAKEYYAGGRIILDSVHVANRPLFG